MRLSEEEYARLMQEREKKPAPPAPVVKEKKPPKFGNKRVQVDGVWFDSKKEAEYIAVLQESERRGEIRSLKFRKVDCKLPIIVNGVPICAYYPDAIYVDVQTDRKVFVDVKSPITRKDPYYRLKVKLVKAVYGIEVREI